MICQRNLARQEGGSWDCKGLRQTKLFLTKKKNIENSTERNFPPENWQAPKGRSACSISYHVHGHKNAHALHCKTNKFLPWLKI